METDYVEIVVSSSKTNTLQSFCDEYLIFFNERTTLKNMNELLTYDGNNERIWDNYTIEEKRTYPVADAALVKFGTTIRVPKDNLTLEVLPSTGNFAVDLTKISLFMPERILEQYQSKYYAPIQQLGDDKDTKTFLGNAYRIYNTISVWCWCKSLGKDGQTGKLINLTPFIEAITINVGETGGNFTFSIAPITCEYDSENGWIITRETYNEYAYKGDSSVLVRDSVIYEKDAEFKRKKFFFHHLLQPNDLVFIEFETLQNEQKVREFDPQVASSQANIFPTLTPANRWWDMIALIDSAKMKYNADAVEVGIEVSGRDLAKVIIDDGCYIYPLDYARGFDPNKGQAIQRVLGRELYFFNAFVDVSIGYLVNFVLNLLSNIAVIKDEALFSGWGNRISYRYDYQRSDIPSLAKEPIMADKPALEDKEEPSANRGQIQRDDKIMRKPAEGIWRIIKLAIDPEISKLRIVDTSITTYQGSLMNYINKVCQKPWVEFMSDTLGDQFYFIVRRPPFTQDAFLDAHDKQGKITIQEDQIVEEELRFDDEEIYSWYRIRPIAGGLEKETGDYIASELTAWFEEFAEIFGAKSFDITTIYSQLYNQKSHTPEELIEQFRRDLIYLIQSTIYLPFTRKGTITITPSDRRIKRGMVIRHAGTDELFYVDSVSNSAVVGQSSVERSTVINVSRGMVELYARNKPTPVNKNIMSYFNIVDFNLDLQQDTSLTSASNFRVNKDVVNFFFKRKQFIDKYTVERIKDFKNGQ